MSSDPTEGHQAAATFDPQTAPQDNNGTLAAEPPVPPLPPGANEDLLEPPEPAIAADGAPPQGSAEQIAGVAVLKGLILYAAVFAFAALYIYFIVNIFQANPGKAPSFDGTLVSAAAALAGVLGSAFALAIGVPTATGETNSALHAALAAPNPSRAEKALSQLRRLLSIAPGSTQTASWPKTLGVWVYAVVGSAVTITYITNQNETPASIKTLAVAFGGYVIALVTTAYGIKAKAAS